jgi:hypothetical protein
LDRQCHEWAERARSLAISTEIDRVIGSNPFAREGEVLEVYALADRIIAMRTAELAQEVQS